MKKISDHKLTGKKLVFRGIVLFIFGLMLIYLRDKAPLGAINLFLTFWQLGNIWDLFLRLFKKRKSNRNLLVLIVEFFIISRILAYNITDITPYAIGILVATYQLFIGLINLVTYILYKKDDIKPRLRLLLDGGYFTTIGVIGITFLTSRVDELMWYLGLFFFFYGLTTIRDGYYFENEVRKNNLKRKTRVSLPLFFAAFIPLRTLRSLNNFLLENSEETATTAYNTAKKDDSEVNFEVFVHTSEEFSKSFGHVDICYRGKVLAFGHYDVLSHKLFGTIGDGVLFEVSRDEYIEFCKKEDNKTIMAFGLQLNPSQLVAIEERISELKSITYPWIPSDKKVVKTKYGSKEPMYSYKLVQETDAKTFKFKESKFKTYFLFSTNCVLLADSIIGKAGTDILNPKGFISPGTYQDYLDREYEKPNSIVVSKKIYKD